MTSKPSPIQARRASLGYSGYRLAKIVAVQSAHLARIEAGECEPGVRLAIRLADALGVEVGALRKLFPEPKEEKKGRAA